jgi:hypothetical protein
VRRIVPILFDVLAAGSLVLCLAAAGAWGRSYWVSQDASLEAAARVVSVSASGGEFLAFSVPSYFVRYFVPPSTPQWKLGTSATIDLLELAVFLAPDAHRPVAGFFYSNMIRGGERSVVVAVPMYAVTAALAVLPAAAVARHVRRRRRGRRKLAGCCVTCGYDLRATPGRCPECGRVAATSDEPAGAGPAGTRPHI